MDREEAIEIIAELLSGREERERPFHRELIQEITGWSLPPVEKIYFIQAGYSGPIKIGRSHDPYRRMAQLQTGHHERLRMLLTFVGSKEEERALHTMAAGLRLEGEWFKDHHALQNMISEIRFHLKPEAANDYVI